MSRSPFLPLGKRMKTMEDTEDSDEEDIITQIFSNSNSHFHSLLNDPMGIETTQKTHETGEGKANNASSGDSTSNNDNSNNTSRCSNRGGLHDRDSIAVSEYSGDTMDIISNVSESDDDINSGRFVHESDDNEDDDDEDDDDEDDDDEDDDDEDDDEEEDDDDDDGDDENNGDDDDEDDDESLIGYPSDFEYEIDQCPADEYLKHDPTPETQYPKPNWITVRELQRRKIGFASSKSTKRQSMQWFQRYVNNSLWMIQRLEIKKRLEEHTGHVNCLNFNPEGNFLCSGSDDLALCIWDWQRGGLRKKIITGHVDNVFYSEFCNNDQNVITSSKDGTVRLLNVETSLSEQILSQSGEISKLAFLTPHTLVTCGTNAYVNFIDLRTKEPERLFIVRNPKDNRSCALHSINSHPIDNHMIVVAGSSPYVYLYDLRRVARDQNEIEHKPTYCVDHFENTNNIVTSTAFNSIGDKLLISYNDDDLYVCQTDTCEILHRYRGHRNRRTIKGCAWFGDNYVLSGSDDGHIYGWDLESEHIVCFLEGDTKGVVNYLSVHPTMPVLASSGLDHEVKVWEPVAKEWPQVMRRIKPHICRNTMHRKIAQERDTIATWDEPDTDS